MSSASLVLRKDLRLLRGTAAAWLLVLVAELLFVLGTLESSLGSARLVRLWSSASLALTLAHLALAAALLLGVIQADAPASPTAFWHTRPLRRRELLAAKALFCLVVIALPWLVGNQAVLAGRGVAAAEALRHLPRLLIVQALLLPPVMVVAALTRSLAGAIVGLVGLATSVALVTMPILALRPVLEWDPRRHAAGELVAALVVIGLAAWALASAYQRRTKRAVALALLGVPLALAPLHAWPWSLAPTRVAPLPACVALAAVDRDRTGTVYVLPEGTDEWARWRAVGTAAVTGVPDGLRALTTWAASEVRLGDGRRQSARVDTASEPEPGVKESVPLLVEGLGPVSLLGGADTIWLAALPATPEAREPGELSATLRAKIRLVRERAVARLPLRAGAGSARLRLRALSLGEPLSIEVDEIGCARPASVLDDTPPDEYRLLGPYRYVLFNAARGEMLDARPTRQAAPSLPMLALGLSVARYRLEVEWPRARPGNGSREAWLPDAELVKIEQLFVAEGERTLEVRDLRLPRP